MLTLLVMTHEMTVGVVVTVVVTSVVTVTALGVTVTSLNPRSDAIPSLKHRHSPD